MQCRIVHLLVFPSFIVNPVYDLTQSFIKIYFNNITAKPVFQVGSFLHLSLTTVC
jgi:hypothetical protein